MKRTAKRLTTLLVTMLTAAACIGSLVACGGGSADPSTLFADTEGLVFSGNKVSFTDKKMTRLFADGEADAGFAVSYTVQGDNPNYNWVDTGGLYVELAGETVDIDGVLEPLYHNIVIFQDPPTRGDALIASNAAIWITENSSSTHGGTEEGANYVTDMSFIISRNPMQVSIAYYHEAYYVMLDRTFKVKLTADTEFGNLERTPELAKFFASGKRKLGFRTAMTPATYSKINVGLGDDAALAAIKKMGLEP